MAIATMGRSTRSGTISGGGTVDMQRSDGDCALNDSQIANASESSEEGSEEDAQGEDAAAGPAGTRPSEGGPRVKPSTPPHLHTSQVLPGRRGWRWRMTGVTTWLPPAPPPRSTSTTAAAGPRETPLQPPATQARWRRGRSAPASPPATAPASGACRGRGRAATSASAAEARRRSRPGTAPLPSQPEAATTSSSG